MRVTAWEKFDGLDPARKIHIGHELSEVTLIKRNFTVGALLVGAALIQPVLSSSVGYTPAGVQAHSAQSRHDHQVRATSRTFGLPALKLPTVKLPAAALAGAKMPAGTVGGTGGLRTLAAAPADIPPQAYVAYARSQQVLHRAMPSCHLSWTLVAAIGRIESDHGRSDGSHLNKKGVATPGIYGPVLNGHGVAKILDTDGGQYDGNTTYDRAVGPMQFLPSTWQIVGVDGDGDGKRNPQDINDAALAAGVYLCSTHQDLSTSAGEFSAAMSYNNSTSYADAVVRIAHAYAKGVSLPLPSLNGADLGTAVASLRGIGSLSISPAVAHAGSSKAHGKPGKAPASPSATPSSRPTTGSSPSGRPTAAPSPTGSPSPRHTPTPSPSGSPTPTLCPSGTPSPTPSPSAASSTDGSAPAATASPCP